MDHVEAVKTLAIERYLLEEMTPEERDSFEAHFFSCAECAGDAREAAAMREGVRGGLAATARATMERGDGPRVIPMRPAAARWRSSVALPWAAAALLAVGLGYQTVAGTRPQLGSVALTPATLRPAGRGQEAVVSPGPGAILTLAVDLGGAPFEGDIQYELERADGKAVASGSAPPPSAGAPLLLMVPTSMLTGSERFVLALHGATGSSLTPVTYRFRVRVP